MFAKYVLLASTLAIGAIATPVAVKPLPRELGMIHVSVAALSECSRPRSHTR